MSLPYGLSSTRRGFTLLELLVIMAVILVLMTIAVPTMQHTRKRANEAAAIDSLGLLNQREGEYNAMFPAHGYACSLTALAGKPGIGAPTPEAAQLVPGDLASGDKGGYRYTLSGCARGAHDQSDTYTLTAVPDSPGSTGDRGFCTDQTGRIRFDPKGATDCTDLLH